MAQVLLLGHLRLKPPIIKYLSSLKKDNRIEYQITYMDDKLWLYIRIFNCFNVTTMKNNSETIHLLQD